MITDQATWNRLFIVLGEDDAGMTVYGYRLDYRGKAIKPYLFRWPCHTWLLESIRDEYGPGDYRLLIRKDREMVFGGSISIGPAPRNRSW